MTTMMPRAAYPALAAILLALPSCVPQRTQEPPPFERAFVSVADVEPGIIVEARYHGAHNFLGRPVAGYEAPKCLLTVQAARALAAAHADLADFGLGLKTYDCYRPQRAVDDFVAWARIDADTATRAEFYPRVPKSALFSEGYIAERSGHSRGSTVDVTIVPLPSPPQPAWRPGQPLSDCRLPADRRFADNSLDMGTGYDCFDPLAHTANPDVPPHARANRLLLKSVMEKHGFSNYEKEWWHFTLRDEPFPDTWFDRPVR